MKLIIDIPNEIVSDISKGYTCQEYADELINLVKNGTPLDKMRAEIEELRYGQPFRKFVVDECLEIIDKYKAGSEVKDDADSN